MIDINSKKQFLAAFLLSTVFLMGSVTPAFAEVLDFISSFDGTDGGGTEFETPFGVAVDSDDRIIVTENDAPLVQIFDSTGSFILEFDGTDGGGSEFVE